MEMVGFPETSPNNYKTRCITIHKANTTNRFTWFSVDINFDKDNFTLNHKVSKTAYKHMAI